SLPMLEAIDEVCLRFEATWKRGQSPEVAPLLPQVADAARGELLGNLIALDLEYRRRRGETPTPESYAGRFPAYRALIEALGQDGGGQPGQPNAPDAAAKQCAPAFHANRATEDVVAGTTLPSPQLVPRDVAVPRRLGKFEVVRPLKQGGQASALLAF